MLDLLRAKRHDFEDPLSLFSVVEMASQVANGMIYLSSKKVHCSVPTYLVPYYMHTLVPALSIFIVT